MSQIKSWWQRRPPGVSRVVLLCIGLLLGAFAARWLMAPHQQLIPITMSDGSVKYMTPEAAANRDFEGDFSENPNPPEPHELTK